jgi:hypothetical protein
MVNQFYYEIEYTIKIEEAGQRGSRGLWPPLAPLDLFCASSNSK